MEHGGNDIFGVPGNFAYPILYGIFDDKDIQWRGSCNELNGGYSADAYTHPNKTNQRQQEYKNAQVEYAQAVQIHTVDSSPGFASDASHGRS